ncbi:MAG: hypothetical protein ACRCX2_14110 [Paraclostridium sp.]
MAGKNINSLDLEIGDIIESVDRFHDHYNIQLKKVDVDTFIVVKKGTERYSDYKIGDNFKGSRYVEAYVKIAREDIEFKF